MSKPGSEPKLKVLVLGVSLRADSLNRKLAALAARVAESTGAAVDHASMRDFDVPSYDGDVESAQGIPKGAQELRRRLLESDAFIVSSPEYNASMPGIDQADLNALAGDAGTQLAGHFWTTSPEALRGYQRFTQLRAFELTERRARDLARSLAGEVMAHWSRFRGEHVH